jgi:hypothetical protein
MTKERGRAGRRALLVLNLMSPDRPGARAGVPGQGLQPYPGESVHGPLRRAGANRVLPTGRRVTLSGG